VLGSDSLIGIARQELNDLGVTVVDLDPESQQQPPVSSISVIRGSGDRTVVSVNATQRQVSAAALRAISLDDIEIVLVDGHQMDLSIALAAQARLRDIPVILDAGSWKPRTDELLQYVDFAICSERFAPTGVQGIQGVFACLHESGVRGSAISRGGYPILFDFAGQRGELPVATGQPVVNTLGAGDVLHGAFCYYYLKTAGDFVGALARASRIASQSCEYFGPREWMKHPTSH
jgi:sugar/nucleoside kinase (ribokinase family)